MLLIYFFNAQKCLELVLPSCQTVPCVSLCNSLICQEVYISGGQPLGQHFASILDFEGSNILMLTLV